MNEITERQREYIQNLLTKKIAMVQDTGWWVRQKNEALGQRTMQGFLGNDNQSTEKSVNELIEDYITRAQEWYTNLDTLNSTEASHLIETLKKGTVPSRGYIIGGAYVHGSWQLATN